MKIKKDYVLRQFVDEYMVIPLGAEGEKKHGVIKLNKVGAELWGLLAEGCSEMELIHYIMEKYSVDEEKATQDTRRFVDQLKEIGCINY